MSNLSLNLVATARDYPHRPALRCDELELTFGQFDAAAARVATFLEHEGIEPGDRVGLMLPNTPAFAVAFYGILRRGAIAVPMNPLLKAREIEFYLTNTAVGTKHTAQRRSLQPRPSPRRLLREPRQRECHAG